ncbi:MAG: DUF2161 family putative PD-(D/E)XK-type phosphodiesterase [Defluviitaleaceae bacterium]|nr:DUF2161 family putative PD-(D/E)XK-type phosphodiesterase [Defluviitaleaceae bacterium]
MYEPIKSLLMSQGFIVRGEVNGCDIAAVRGEELWIVEMKLSANLTLIFQAMARQEASENVFIAVPRPKSGRDKKFRALRKLVKKLELGLIVVSLDSPVCLAEILIFPKNAKREVCPTNTSAHSPEAATSRANKKASAIKKEIFGRTTDSPGGTSREKVNTAYRERCVKIACLLEARGAQSAKSLREMGCESDAYPILRGNHFGWFEKIDKGIYDITETCRNYLNESEDVTLITYYRMKAEYSESN